MLDFECVVAIVERGKAEKVVEDAKAEGARGATIFYGRGTGESEIKKFLNMHIEASKEIIFILAEQSKVKRILGAIVESGRLKEPGSGIVFTLPVSSLIGLRHRDTFEALEID